MKSDLIRRSGQSAQGGADHDDRASARIKLDLFALGDPAEPLAPKPPGPRSLRTDALMS
jgi:hypothetical protein